MDRVVFETERLTIRLGEEGDAGLFYRVWTDPRVMTNVGFPFGLQVTEEEIERNLRKPSETEFGRLLVAELKSTREAIGECHMKLPNDEGIATTDVKLLPEHWGNRYGVEIKQGLLDHLFRRTDCKAVEATPNIGNIASIRMQEAVGGVRIGQRTHEFPESMQQFTCPVTHYIYRVDRSTWMRQERSNRPI
jgi:RimJ/RimL family protein N-acetyltransferase